MAYDGTSVRIATVTDPLDAAGRLATVTDPANGETRYTYDPAHRLLTITDARGITFLTNTYDAAGRVATQTDAAGGVTTFGYVVATGGSISTTTVTDRRGSATQYHFNPAGYLIGETDALGQATTLERDPGTNLLVSLTDPLNRVTAFV